jgi:hypothetical protein
MAQNLNVALPTLTYTRTDYTALRAWIQRLPLERVAQLGSVAIRAMGRQNLC